MKAEPVCYMRLNNVSDIIFDLGNVLLDIDFTVTESKLEVLIGIPIDDLKRHLDRQFIDFETGRISYILFFNHLIKCAGTGVQANDLIHAWNAMLLEIKPEIWTLLEKLKQNHRLFLLSNTNDIHLQWFNAYLRKHRKYEQWYGMFEKCYYSHEIGMRKPDAAVYRYIVEQHDLVPQSTLFVDDTAANIDAANSLGLRTLLFDRHALTLEEALRNNFVV